MKSYFLYLGVLSLAPFLPLFASRSQLAFEQTIKKHQNTFKKLHWGAKISTTSRKNFELLGCYHDQILPDTCYVIRQFQLIKEGGMLSLGLGSLNKEQHNLLLDLPAKSLGSLEIIKNDSPSLYELESPIPCIGDRYQKKSETGEEQEEVDGQQDREQGDYIIGVGELPGGLHQFFDEKKHHGWRGILVLLKTEGKEPLTKEERLIITHPYFIPEKLNWLSVKGDQVTLGMNLGAGINFLQKSEEIFQAMQLTKPLLPSKEETYNALLLSYREKDHHSSGEDVYYLKGGLTFHDPKEKKNQKNNQGTHQEPTPEEQDNPLGDQKLTQQIEAQDNQESRMDHPYLFLEEDGKELNPKKKNKKKRISTDFPYLFLMDKVDGPLSRSPRSKLKQLQELENKQEAPSSSSQWVDKKALSGTNLKREINKLSNKLGKEGWATKSQLMNRYLTLYPGAGSFVPVSPSFKAGEYISPCYHTGSYQKNLSNKRGTVQRKMGEKEQPFMKSVILLKNNLFLTIEEGFFHYKDPSFQEKMRDIARRQDHFENFSIDGRCYLFIKSPYIGIMHGDDNHRSFAIFLNQANTTYTKKDQQIFEQYRKNSNFIPLFLKEKTPPLQNQDIY